ncbi:thiolase family protein [Chloroflexota bacterium]
MQSKAYIIGYGQTKCGFFAERDVRSLISDAYIKALDYSGIDPDEIQQMWLSHYPPQADLQMTVGQVAIEAVGLGSRVGCICIEQACASGGQAIHDAALAIESGRYQCILLAGFGKMTDSMIPSGRDGLYLQAEGPFEESGFNPFYSHAGAVLSEPGMGTDWAKASHRTVEALAAWNVLEYWYATKHTNALCYGEPIPTQEELMEHGGGGLESAGCDGASMVILASKDFAKHYTDKLIYIAGVSHKLESSYYAKSLDYGYGSDLPRGVGGKIGYTHSVENCWKECFEQAGVEPKDLDLANTHDCTDFVACLQLEGMHHPLIPDNTSYEWIIAGEAYPWGRLPLWTQGSARFGQPRGATCINYLIENYVQLKEECGEWQVPIRNGVAAGMVSPGRPNAHILRREK